MEKPNIMKLLPAILGFAALAVPAFGFEKDGIAIWIFGGVAAGGEVGTLSAEISEKHPEMVLMSISGIVFAVGATLALLSALGVLKLGKLAWLPGVIMIAGAPLYFIGLAETEILLIAPVVINIACGALGGVWALVDAIKSTKS